MKDVYQHLLIISAFKVNFYSKRWYIDYTRIKAKREKKLAKSSSSDSLFVKNVIDGNVKLNEEDIV